VSTRTARAQAPSTHQNHRPSRTMCTPRRYRRCCRGGDLTRCGGGAAGRRPGGRLVDG
jgi:hypothetical protein